jgi:hypothetical protein
VTPYSDVREGGFPFYYTGSSGTKIPYNGLINDDASLWESGSHSYDDPAPVVEEGEEEPVVVKEVHFVVNGRNMDEKPSFNMQGWRCADNVCPDEYGDKPVETETRNWSDAASWSDGLVPAITDDDDCPYVEVESGWNMIYDVEGDSELFCMVKIMGRLTFKQPEEGETIDLHLRTKHIFVAAGELIIGTEDDPYRGNAQITLYGTYEDESTVFNGAIEAGNKVISVVGLVSMYGAGPVTQMTRLLAPAVVGATSISVDPATDWAVGDRIFLAATSFNHESGEYVTVSAIDAGTVTLVEELSHYHYGAAESTAATYNGIVDIRGEVVNLNRNIKLVGDNVELDQDWGGQMVCGDTVEVSGAYRAC